MYRPVTGLLSETCNPSRDSLPPCYCYWSFQGERRQGPESIAPSGRRTMAAGSLLCSASNDVEDLVSLPREYGLALLHERSAAFDVVLAGEAVFDQFIAARKVALTFILDRLADDELHRLKR